MLAASAEIDRAAQALLTDDAAAIGARVVSGELRAAALLEASLLRIGALDPRLGAVCWLAPQAGREAARAIDEEVAAVAGRPQAQQELLARRPFAGVPFLLKDLGLAAVGIPSQMGSRLFGAVAGTPVHWRIDAELVTRYRAAGLVIFGRTTTPELGISATTEARFYGRPTRNPWDPGRSAGGSSGGAGAAVAARLVPIAHASDGAGSIRIPASCCGLVGLKPSRALMPNGPLNGEAWGGFATEHVLTQSVRDCALALAVSAGADAGAAYAAPPVDAVALRRLASEPAVGQSRWRVGIIDSFFEGDPIDPRIAAAVGEVAKLLQDRGGHHVEAARIPVATTDIVETVIRTMACWTGSGIEAFCRARQLDLATLSEDALEPATWGALRLGQRTSAADYVGLMVRTNSIARAVAAAVARFAILLMPVLAEPPALLGRFAMDNPDYLDYRLGSRGLIRYSPFTPLANLTGQPALSLPLATVDGLPVGLQLIGRIGADAGLLALAADLEQWLPWRDRRPEWSA
jgi:amidase